MYVRRSVLRLGLAAVWVGALAGCEERPPTLRIIGEAYAPLEALSQIAPSFEERTGVRVEIEQYDFETAVERVNLDLVSGTGRYDVVLQPNMNLGRLARAGLLLPLEEYWPDEGAESVSFDDRIWYAQYLRDLGEFSDTLYGVPFTANTMFLWYRADLFSDSSEQDAFGARYGYPLRPPDTWAQYRDVAEFFTRPSQNLWGTTLQGRRHPAIWYEWLNFAYSFGGGVIDQDVADEYGDLVLSCPETIAATEFYQNLLAFAPPEARQSNWDEALAAFQAGRVAMGLMWNDAAAFVEDSTQSTVAGRLGYSTPPRIEGGTAMAQTAGWTYLVPRSSTNADLAGRFIAWATTLEQQVTQQLSGGASAARATYEDPGVAAVPYMEAYGRSLEIGRTMSGSVPETVEVSETLQVCLTDILAGDDVSARLASCEVELAALLPATVERRCAGEGRERN